MRSRLHWVLLRWVLIMMFRVALPLAARLPLRQGMWAASVLGHMCYWLDMDWRTVALQDHFVGRRTRLAVAEIAPELSEIACEAVVRERFLNASREELEGHWFAIHRAAECVCEFEGFDPIREHLARKKGLVLLTMHFDAALMGVVQLGLAGCKMNLMTSDVVEDARVAPCAQRYFERKYDGIQSYLSGGRAMHVETNLKRFYGALKHGEGVVILGEAPTDQLPEAAKIQLFGKRRAVAPGAFRLAEKTGCPIAAFVCVRSGVGRYKVVCSPIHFATHEEGHAANAGLLFDFLSAQIRMDPAGWWAADQLPNFINLDS